ncbi:heat shock protein Hsp18 [Clostridium pasteurianum]|uniref:Molecular chaperone (Small heat shock protein) n=1 Tax=Clostridium pasteurianum BC1 TaxID=86416 RepID=R4KGC5_CLOPA|nr:heat shock protein Hsp18 [Clostridium pasteurianum]AGK99554.1 molecular chaperone (small heat shock protein) [Clostridium pasteurianum BC1]
MFDMVPFRRNNGVTRTGSAFDDLFNNFLGDNFFSPSMMNTTGFKVDLKEDENAYTLEADLPGVKKDDIALDYENNYLTISAKRDETIENKEDNYVRRERRYGQFKRSFYVDNVNESAVDAYFVDGVLKVTLPKKDKGIEKKKIDIH